MRELFRDVPDADVLLALTPEELGRKLLLILVARNQTEFHESGLLEEIWNGPAAREGLGYVAANRDLINFSVAEALGWLRTHDLIIPQPGEHRPSGHMKVTRLGWHVAWEGPRGDHSAVVHLKKTMLHPAIAEAIWIEMARGDFSDAIFKAMRAVEVAVREAGGFEPRHVGVKLMTQAFGPTGPLRDREADTAEADALMQLFMGAIGSYKNPHSHRNVAMTDAGEAIEIVMLASHLLRIVDARRPPVAAT